jgi:hypothetical protein
MNNSINEKVLEYPKTFLIRRYTKKVKKSIENQVDVPNPVIGKKERCKKGTRKNISTGKCDPIQPKILTFQFLLLN